MKQAIEAFLTWANTQSSVDKDNINNLTLLSAQYSTLEQDKNVLTFQEQKIERNRIIRALLHFLDEKGEIFVN